MSGLRKLAGQTVIYGASSIIGRVLNYLLVPLYTAVFTAGEYGVVTELYAYVAFLNVFYTYGLETAYFRFATRNESKTDYFNVAQSSILVTSLLISGVLWALSDDIASALAYPKEGVFIRWLALILAIDAITALPFARLRLENKGIRFATFKLVNIGVNIGLNLFFLVFCPYWLATNPDSLIGGIYNPAIGVGYVFLSNLIANALYLLFFLPDWGRYRFTFSKEWLPMLIYAAPLLILGLAGVTNEMLSRALLKYWLPENFYPGISNQEALGIFGACYKLSVFMTLAVQAFRYAFEPFFFSKSGDSGSPELFAKVMHGFILFGTFSWLVISLLLPDFAFIFLRRPAYLEALSTVPWLLGGGLFLGIYYNLSIWYKLTDQTKWGAWISLFGAAITVILNFLLIPIWGYIGSAITTLVSYLVMTLVSYFIGQSRYPVPYYWQKGSFYILLSALLIAAFYFCGIGPTERLVIGAASLIIFSLIVWLLDIRTGFFKKNATK